MSETTTETPMALEVCCCGNCAAEGHEKTIIRPLTAEEIAQREIDAKAWADQQAAEEAAVAERDALKASARAKLIAGQPLTEAEAALLVI